MGKTNSNKCDEGRGNSITEGEEEEESYCDEGAEEDKNVARDYVDNQSRNQSHYSHTCADENDRF